VIHNLAKLSGLVGAIIGDDTAASAEIAIKMAQGIQRAMGATFGLGIERFPTVGVPVATAATNIDMAGTLHVALASADNVRVKSFPVATHPSITKTRSAKQALNMLRLAMLNRDM
jgi:nicotinamide mononucleotide (NMN) deamidase PncC